MGTGITLRWQLAPFACEFHWDGGQGLLLLRAGAEIIARDEALAVGGVPQTDQCALFGRMNQGPL